MATIKVNGTSYFISSSKITTPSIKINGQGYIPLFSGNKNSTVDYNRYRYTLGELKVGSYRAAVSRSFINHAPTVSISASASSVANGTNVTLTATGSDPDGDTLTYEWNRYENARDQSTYIGSGSSITVSDSNKTWNYWCSVSDPYGASATSEVRTVTWYEPNHSPRIVISGYPSVSKDGNIQFTITCYDEDNDSNCTVTYGWQGYGSGGSLNDHQTTSLTHMNATASGAQSTGRTVSGATKQGPDTNGDYWYFIYATITDSHGSTARDSVRIKHANNNAPVIRLSNVPSTSSNGSISFTIVYGDTDHDNCTLEYGYARYYQNSYEHDISTGSTSVSTPNNVSGSSFGQSKNVTVNADEYYDNYMSGRFYRLYAKITDSYGGTSRATADVSYVAPTPTYAYKCTVECWRQEHDAPGYSTNKPCTWHVKITPLRYPSSCDGIYVFADRGDGTGWIYKSTEIDFWDNSKPSTIDLTPYTTFTNTFTYTDGYRPVTVTTTDYRATGTVKTVAVSFSDTVGESHKNTYTFEWN